MCGSVFMCMPVPWRPEEGVWCPGAGVTGECEDLESGALELELQVDVRIWSGVPRSWSYGCPGAGVTGRCEDLE